jgi:peptide/nickel transport system ATP-binding protein
LYADPKHPYTKALLSAIPMPDPKVRRQRMVLQGDVPSPIKPPTGCAFHPRCPLRMAGCDGEIPVLKNLGGDHQVACYLY